MSIIKNLWKAVIMLGGSIVMVIAVIFQSIGLVFEGIGLIFRKGYELLKNAGGKLTSAADGGKY